MKEQDNLLKYTDHNYAIIHEVFIVLNTSYNILAVCVLYSDTNIPISKHAGQNITRRHLVQDAYLDEIINHSFNRDSLSAVGSLKW